MVVLSAALQCILFFFFFNANFLSIHILAWMGSTVGILSCLWGEESVGLLPDEFSFPA